MIITIKGADFSKNNINPRDAWSISRNLEHATYSGDNYVNKGAALNATVTIAEGYELGDAGVTVTMGGSPVTSGITVDGNTITISIGSVTGNVMIKVPTKAVVVDGGEPETPDIGGGDNEESAALKLYQGYANENNMAELPTRVRTGFIEGAFSVTTNSGYVIRAIYEYNSPDTKSGTAIATAEQQLTTYTKTDSTKYCIITFCKTDATANISPTENIVANFTGKIYEDSGNSGESTDEPTAQDYIEVSGIKITMGQLIAGGLKAHTGRAYTVDNLNNKTSISTEGSDFVMIPILDTDNDLTNTGNITCYTNTDGTFAASSASGGSLTYHSNINIADLKALNADANVHIMFKHNTASSFNLSDLSSAVTIV